MPLLRAPAAFDHPDWLFELKHDGFRGLAVVEGHRCRLLSRYGRDFKQWPQLQEEIAHAVRAQRAVLDGEIVCLRPDGRSDFYALKFRRDWPYFYAFDLLSLEGKDLRARPLLERKQRLAEIIRTVHAGNRYVDPELAADAISSGDSPLTAREAEVLEFAADGAPVAEIADRAALSQGTVRNYLSSAVSKLGVENRHAAVRLARERGWV